MMTLLVIENRSCRAPTKYRRRRRADHQKSSASAPTNWRRRLAQGSTYDPLSMRRREGKGWNWAS